MTQDMQLELLFSDFLSDASKDTSKARLANNIDLGEWKTVYEELKEKIPKKLIFSSPNDWISFLRHEVRGITQPQFNIQLEGSWIGGHQEPMG